MNQFQMYSFYLEQKEAALNNMALSAEKYSEMNILQSASTVSRQATSHKVKKIQFAFSVYIFFLNVYIMIEDSYMTRQSTIYLKLFSLNKSDIPHSYFVMSNANFVSLFTFYVLLTYLLRNNEEIAIRLGSKKKLKAFERDKA